MCDPLKERGRKSQSVCLFKTGNSTTSVLKSARDFTRACTAVALIRFVQKTDLNSTTPSEYSLLYSWITTELVKTAGTGLLLLWQWNVLPNFEYLLLVDNHNAIKLWSKKWLLFCMSCILDLHLHLKPGLWLLQTFVQHTHRPFTDWLIHNAHNTAKSLPKINYRYCNIL